MLDEQIDENLRRVYGQALNQPLPDKFAHLLDKLRQQQGGDSPAAEGKSQESKGECRTSDGDEA